MTALPTSPPVVREAQASIAGFEAEVAARTAGRT